MFDHVLTLLFCYLLIGSFYHFMLMIKIIEWLILSKVIEYVT